ncbi:MAG: flagellar basal body-associated FliL family protein [Pseudomonadota bacterium]
MKKIIIIAVAVLLLGIAAGGAAYFMLGGKADTKAGAPPDAEGEAGEEVAMSGKTPIYHGLDPDFVIAFQNPKKVRFLKASLEVVVYDQDVIDDLKLHMPAVRDAVLLLFSTQEEDNLLTVEGKEAFRAQILEKIRSTMERLTGRPGVEAVYFSNFVMQ